MILYHFTAREHMPEILRTGVLKLVESNISPKREHAGPDVVWLTNNPMWPIVPEGDSIGYNGLIHLKTAVRITVDVSHAKRWRKWAQAQGVDQRWLAALAHVGGSRSWYVVTTPIKQDNWVAIDVNPALGETLTGPALLDKLSGIQPQSNMAEKMFGKP